VVEPHEGSREGIWVWDAPEQCHGGSQGVVVYVVLNYCRVYNASFEVHRESLTRLLQMIPEVAPAANKDRLETTVESLGPPAYTAHKRRLAGEGESSVNSAGGARGSNGSRYTPVTRLLSGRVDCLPRRRSLLRASR